MFGYSSKIKAWSHHLDTEQFKTNNNNNNNNNNNKYNDNDNTNKCITKGWLPWTLFFQQGI